MFMQEVRRQHQQIEEPIVRKAMPDDVRYHQPAQPESVRKPEREIDTGHAVAVKASEQEMINNTPLCVDDLRVVADEIAQMLDAERKHYTREMTAALREMQIELAKTQSEVAELRSALAAMRTGKALDLPMPTRTETLN
jgi:hypothetical protein